VLLEQVVQQVQLVLQELQAQKELLDPQVLQAIQVNREARDRLEVLAQQDSRVLQVCKVLKG